MSPGGVLSISTELPRSRILGSLPTGRQAWSGRLSAGASPCAWFVMPAGFPGMQAGPPGGYRAPVGLVVGTEAAREGGFLVEAHERRDDQPNRCGVQQQTEPAQEQRLANDGRQYRHVHGVTDVAIHSADDQTLGRGDRRRCPEALHYETNERPNQRNQARNDQ